MENNFINVSADSGMLANLTIDEFLGFVKESLTPVEQFFANYNCAIMEIETKFKVLNEQFSLQYDGNPIESIKSRLKSYDSIIRKVYRKEIDRSLSAIEESITDVAGVRVICSFEEDIYKLADCLLQQDDIVLLEKRDYIKNPMPSGYRSLHLIVTVPIFLENDKKIMKVEVQLRTIAMDFWASLEHKMRYKKDIPLELQDSIAKDLMECAETSAYLDARMQEIRNKILQL